MIGKHNGITHAAGRYSWQTKLDGAGNITLTVWHDAAGGNRQALEDFVCTLPLAAAATLGSALGGAGGVASNATGN
ncbi:MAG TPA: hypothetical protein VFT22_10920 [Kofleriaceae bacterium]|nr:hypothetical protein [Kofleriaceae bacterium]